MRKKTRRIFEKARRTFYKYREYVYNGDKKNTKILNVKLGEFMYENELTLYTFASKEVLINEWHVFYVPPGRYKINHGVYLYYKKINADKAIKLIS